MRLRARRVALGFALLAILRAETSWAEGASLDAASKQQVQAASKAFEAADVLYDAKQYAQALSAFRASYDVVKSPNARLMIGRSLRELGRLGEAYAEAKAAVTEAEAAAQRHPRYAETARAAREDLAALKARVGFVKLDLGSNAESGATVKVGERSFDAPALYEPIAITPGTTTMIVSVPGQAEQRRDIVVEAGKLQTVALDREPQRSLDGAEGSDAMLAEEPREPVETKVELGPDSSMRTWAYVAGGVGAVGLATFGVFGVLNNSRYGELDDDCPNGACPSGRNDDIEAGRRYQLIANVGLGVGIVGLGTGVTLLLLSGKQSTETARRTTLRVAPGAVSIEGRF
jgi:hypothetical protein